MKRIATAAALAGLMLMGIGTAFAVSAHSPAAAVGPMLLDRSGGPGLDDTPTPSPSATPGDDDAVCAEDRDQDADEQEDCDVNDDRGANDNDVDDNDQHQRGPDQSGQSGQSGHHGDDRQVDDHGGTDSSQRRG